MHVYWEGPNCVTRISRNYRLNMRHHADARRTTLHVLRGLPQGRTRPYIRWMPNTSTC